MEHGITHANHAWFRIPGFVENIGLRYIYVGTTHTQRERSRAQGTRETRFLLSFDTQRERSRAQGTRETRFLLSFDAQREGSRGQGTRERRFLLSFDDARRHAKIVLLPLD